jgi:hypothetical protein
MAAPSNKKNQSFWLPESVIKRAAKDEQITALHVGALLAIACHTDRSGIYSSAGAYAVRNALCIGDKKAAELLKHLDQWGYLKDATRLHPTSKLKKAMPDREGRAAVRWVIPPDEQSRKIWFPSTIVHGVGKWGNPLADLRRCGDLAARMLLNLYRHEDLGQFGGLDPTKTFFRICELEDEPIRTSFGKRSQYGWLFIASKESNATAWCSFSDEVRAGKNEENKLTNAFWSAIKKLETKGFIYECLTVFTGTKVEQDNEMNLLYPLHTFNRHGHPPKGEESLAGKTANIAKVDGHSIADYEGRFDGSTFAFVADDKEAQLVGIYRLRFRDVSPLNHEGVKGWGYLQTCRREWEDRLS